MHNHNLLIIVALIVGIAYCNGHDEEPRARSDTTSTAKTVSSEQMAQALAQRRQQQQRDDARAQATSVATSAFSEGLHAPELIAAADGCQAAHITCPELETTLKVIANGFASCTDASEMCQAVREYAAAGPPLLKHLPVGVRSPMPMTPLYSHFENPYLEAEAKRWGYREEMKARWRRNLLAALATTATIVFLWWLLTPGQRHAVKNATGEFFVFLVMQAKHLLHATKRLFIRSLRGLQKTWWWIVPSWKAEQDLFTLNRKIAANIAAREQKEEQANRELKEARWAEAVKIRTAQEAANKLARVAAQQKKERDERDRLDAEQKETSRRLAAQQAEHAARIQAEQQRELLAKQEADAALFSVAKNLSKKKK